MRRAAFKSCCNKAISDGVSIRGVFEVASFRPGKLVEAKSEVLPPPLLEFLSMLESDEIVRCRMVRGIFASAFFFVSACSAISLGQRVPEQGNSSRFEPGSHTNSFDCNAGTGKYL